MSVPTSKGQVLIDGLYFGECPRWHEGRMWFSDFYDHGIFSVTEDGDRRQEVEYPGEPAGLGWLPDGRLLINSRLDRVVMRREHDGTLVKHGDLQPWATGHANDMVVASNGQAYAGNFGFVLEQEYDGTVNRANIGPTSLVRVDPDGTSHEACDNMAFPNGTVITEDGSLLIVAESMGGCLTAFDRAADGTLSNRRQWADLPEGIAPDGICLCADDTIWVANALGAEFVRVTEGGDVVERVETASGLGSFACMLGGEDRKTLFMVTAATSDQEAAQVKRTGCIEIARTTVPGTGKP
jgi:sugar lactone lactonase YvrE